MQIIRAKNYDEMSRLSGELIISQIHNNPCSVLGLATGTTPIGTYDIISDSVSEGFVDFANVRTINLDEYCGLSGDHPQSFRYFMDKFFFSRINIDRKNTFLPDGCADDFEVECKRYEKIIEESGRVDLQLLGIGNNGHIGFNEPSSIFPKETHVVKLTKSTITANSRLFENKEEVPSHAITMGIGTIMKAKKILLIVTGKNKSKILEKSLKGPVDPRVPASILQFHHDVTVIVDSETVEI